ncbi:alanine/ornithine racemase family PLP-dependent enzyme [Anoxynatronum buryatiense]|uniref:Ornithine racemase n=1 Tax=Anoxynatronum buryatiense TaxID=489973 RepID=A0AA45WUQ5_9CLOT|nr:alanine/ornithine racemase family PLP-dependent enzyme [Anoxynatronum buryatiense]SMP49158.1 ornithine racemase [Anoxynatronum buryatiense]
MNPRIKIHLGKLTHNAALMVDMCAASGIKVSAVTKGFCAKPQAAAALLKGGITSLADSRIENLRKLQPLEAEKLLLRLPMINQAEQVVWFSDISLNSQWATIQALNKAAGKRGVRHGVILMMDLGDLREGLFSERAFLDLVKNTCRLSHIDLKGIGTNLTCFGAILPDEKNLGRLKAIAEQSVTIAGKPLEMVSGGNSSSLYLLQEGKLPEGINHLRIGEGILLGTESAYGTQLPNMNHDCFQLVAELIEVEEKPSVPTGTIGKDAFGQVPVFEDRGIRKRAIAAVGKQDFATHAITPLNQGVEILGASSDHLILDISDASRTYRVGDEVTFSLSYGAMLALNTSSYVSTQYVEGA